MKQFLMIVAMALFCSATVTAQNPDSRPSVSLGIGGVLGSGEYQIQGVGQDEETEGFKFGAGLQLPVSENITLNFGVGLLAGNTEYKENLFFYRSKTDYKRFDFAFTAKFYIGPSINK